MSEINHPFIDPEQQQVEPTELALEFAITAHGILSSHRYFMTEMQDGVQATKPYTSRVDIISDDPANITALRLRRVLTSAFTSRLELARIDTQPGVFLDAPEDNQTDYLVLALEHGSVDPEDFDDEDEVELEDSDFTWESYAVAVTDRSTCDAYVIDGRTGVLFSDGDIMQALYGLQLLQKELGAEDFDHSLWEDDSNIKAQSLKTDVAETYTAFDEQEAVELIYGHHYCAPDCAVPGSKHQNSMHN